MHLSTAQLQVDKRAADLQAATYDGVMNLPGNWQKEYVVYTGKCDGTGIPLKPDKGMVAMRVTALPRDDENGHQRGRVTVRDFEYTGRRYNVYQFVLMARAHGLDFAIADVSGFFGIGG